MACLLWVADRALMLPIEGSGAEQVAFAQGQDLDGLDAQALGRAAGRHQHGLPCL